MEYKFLNNGSYNIHLIKTDRFKNIKIDVNFRNNINREELFKRAFLFDMLVESNSLYKTKRDIILKCENLYNATLYSSICKDGNMVSNSVQMSILNPKYTKSKYYAEAIKLIFDIIFKPDIINNEFNADTFNKIKNRYLNNINEILENPTNTALLNSLDLLDSVTSEKICGTKEEIDLLTSESLVSLYNKVLNHDYIDIFVLGDIDINKTIDLIDKYALFNTIKTHKIDMYVENKKRKKCVVKKDSSHFLQSQIVVTYNYNNLTDYEKKYVAPVFNTILGGGNLDSKLYKNVREKNSLCYSIRSKYKRFDNIGFIITSVDHSNTDFAIKLIKETLKEMNKINETELKNAISLIITSLNMKFDIPDAIIDEYYFSYLGELDPIEERIKNFMNIKIEDVIKLNKKISLNSIYIMGGNNEKN